MGYIIFAIISVLVILALAAMWAFGTNPADQYDNAPPFKTIGKWLTVGVTVVFLGITLALSLTQVGSRSVGIQTAFGRYQDTLDNGLQLTAPWSSVEEFSTQVQYLDLDSTDGSDDAVSVTFKGGGGGTVSLTPRWSIDEDKAEDLWKKYKTFDKVQNQLVNSSAKDSVRVVVSKYTPNDARDGENLRPIADAIQADLAKSLSDDGVKIDSVSIKKITLDARSQNSLDKIVEANNNVERAKAERERAKIDAETAKIREQSGQLSEKAAQRYCLEMMNNWDVKKNGSLPAGFVCPGTNSQGYVTTNK